MATPVAGLSTLKSRAVRPERPAPMTNSPGLLLAAFAGLLCFLPSCGGSNATSSTPTPIQTPAASQATITVVASPNPITATACTSTSCAEGWQWHINGNVTVTETAGVSGNVNYVNLTFLRGGYVGNTVNYGADYIGQRLGTNHVGARGKLTIPIGYVFRTGDGGSDILLNVKVDFTDDRGHELTESTQWTVM